ncbi:type II toxin-antitoxin system HicB family antitoxin [bacterium]|nr:type II toxin-antitoxin system HicB family antitoxin [bacterium]
MNKDLEYYLRLPYQIVLTPGEDPGDGWLAEIPALPGCFTAGETREEALEMLDDAKRLWLESSLAHGDPIPEPTQATAS